LKAIATVALATLLAITASRAAVPYDGSWESLQKMPVPAWFEDGKIGIFIHWGPYSVDLENKVGEIEWIEPKNP